MPQISKRVLDEAKRSIRLTKSQSSDDKRSSSIPKTLKFSFSEGALVKVRKDTHGQVPGTGSYMTLKAGTMALIINGPYVDKWGKPKVDLLVDNDVFEAVEPKRVVPIDPE